MGVKAGAIPATGSTTVSGLGGPPRCIFFLGTNQSIYETTIQPGNVGGFFGYFADDVNGDHHNFCEFAILSTGRCSNMFQKCARAQTACSPGGTSNVLYEAEVTAISDTSFTIDFSVGSAAHQIHYLAVWGIDPCYPPFVWEENCRGNHWQVDVGFEPGVFVAVQQWRDSCDTFPKSTSTSNWYGKVWGDVDWNSSCWDTAGQSVISGIYGSGTTSGPFGTETPVGSGVDPFVLGSICTGVNYVTHVALPPTIIEFFDVGCGDGQDYAYAQYSLCFQGDCDTTTGIGGGAIGSEFLPTIAARALPPEAVIFNNFQKATEGAANGAEKRWGAGFATPDYQCGYSMKQSDGSFYQSESNCWVSKTSGVFASAGTVNFAPAFGDISFTTHLNSAGSGEIGWMAIKTYCPEEELLVVALDPLNTNRFIGTWHESRGGIGDADPGS